jgi:hypothetical protein
MASEQDVKQYLAYWVQLGKGVVIPGERQPIVPASVICGSRYSAEFEALWARVRLPASGDCYLQGTQQTIAELLTSRWAIDPCARCAMLVPMPNFGLPSLECPCTDVPNWPNTELPLPRSPVSSYERLGTIRDRLRPPAEVE